MLVVDLETEGIVGNPTVNPPIPVGVALKRPGFKSVYHRWGHPTGNNCSGPAQAKRIIQRHINEGDGLLFHNAKFDTAVLEAHMDIFMLDPLKVHDSMFLVFLADPYAHTFALKPSSERLLDWPAEERDRLKEWILAHIQCKPSEWGAHIADAPGGLVDPYARGDVDRTLGLFEKLYPHVPKEAYQREQRLLPIIMASERKGVLLDQERLEGDMAGYEADLLRCEQRIFKKLGVGEFKLSGADLANALEKAGKVSHWVLTPTGKRSTARGNLEKSIDDPKLLALLQYHGALAHCLSTFGRPWQVFGRAYNGRLHPAWNQVRQAQSDNKSKGTRTGRLSCMAPNFMAMPNEYHLIIPPGFHDLPIMREYLLPDKGYVWLKRDYSQQEMRILAHFSEGRLYRRYRADPRIDAHVETQALIKEYAHLDMVRKYVKITGFSMIYGSGIPHLSSSLGVSAGEAYNVKAAYLTALPEVKELSDDCKDIGKAGDCITTWGGREYYTEPPKIVKNAYRSFEYKLLNYLIQGSAADCTKESIIRHDADKGNGEFLCTVHDENNIQAPKDGWKMDMKKLRKAMEGIEFDVKMLSDGFVGPSWAQLKACK